MTEGRCSASGGPLPREQRSRSWALAPPAKPSSSQEVIDRGCFELVVQIVRRAGGPRRVTRHGGVEALSLASLQRLPNGLARQLRRRHSSPLCLLAKAAMEILGERKVEVPKGGRPGGRLHAMLVWHPR